jgi:hypothetical protein
VLLDFGCDGFGGVQPAGAGHHIGTGLGEPDRHGFADAGSASDYDRYLAGKVK